MQTSTDRSTGGSDPTEQQVAELLGAHDWSRLAEALGYETVEAPVPVEAFDAWGLGQAVAGAIDELRVLAAADGYRLLLARGVTEYRDLRRGMLEAQKRNSSECLIWWLVGDETVSVAVASRNREGRMYLRRMETRTSSPDPVALRQWVELRVGDLVDAGTADPGRAIRRQVESVLDQEGITREFFGGFREALETLTVELERGPEADEARHDIALATLLRLVFLYFLQQRGALDEDRRFVLRHYRAATADGGDFYRSVLRPLFFGALNRTPGEREGRAADLGRLPFLNGGLFEPIPAERQHPELDWPEAVWPKIIEGLFERFHFTVDEGVGADEHRAVDPEMLGKVFEGLMYGERRHESGSFYTPRDVVREVVSGTLATHLADETGLEASSLREAIRTGEADWPEAAGDALIDELAALRVLDPAVGTGAFLLEVLRSVEKLAEAVRPVEEGEAQWRRRRRVIHSNLFGVDIQRTAVRICELRLWLALLSVMPDWEIGEIPPLPNLGHRIGCGNSLMAPTDPVAYGSEAGSRGAPSLSGVAELEAEHRRSVRETQDAFFEAHGAEKAELKRRLESLETDIQRRLLGARRSKLREKLEPYEQLEQSEDLFGDEIELDDQQRRTRDGFREQLEAVETAIEELEAGRERRGGFAYAARFGPVLDEEGFDVVVTNPPWIRANRLTSARRRLLQARYRSYSNELWEGAGELGIRVPFGAQVDVAALFVERALELLREGGRVAALVPAKLFRSLHGTGLRRRLAEEQLEVIRDYGDSDRKMFDATVYPAVVQVAKTSGDRDGRRRRGSAGRDPRGREPRCREGSFDVTVWSGADETSWSTELGDVLTLGRDVGEPWTFVPPGVAEVFRRMRSQSTPLGAIEKLQPSRGLMTGRNEVFVLDDEVAREQFGDRAESWTRPALSGRDVRAWQVESDRRLIWGYDDQLDPCGELPESLTAYFERHAEELESRADHNPTGPLWQLFRLKPGLVQPKVVWRDLAPRLEAGLAGEEVVPLNTVYFIPLDRRHDAEAAMALFNSEPMRAVAYAVGERARGGWRRHFAWVMRLLPVPDPFVGRLEAGTRWEAVDAVEFDGSPSAAERARLDQWAAELFGLEVADLERLRAWRGESGDESREAA